MKKVLLLYYSGSGSTKTISEILFERISTFCDITAIEIKQNFDYSLLDGYDVYFFAFPTYHSDPPNTVMEFIDKMPAYVDAKKAFALNTFALYHENCLRTFILKLQEKNMLVNSYISIKGPASDAILFYPDEWLRNGKYEIQIAMKIEWAITRFDKVLQSEENKIKIPGTRWYTFINRPLLKFFVGRFEKAKNEMKVIEKRCTNCNHCVDICPRDCWSKGMIMPNVSIAGCETCFRCVHNCPTRAISIADDMIDKFRFDEAFYVKQKKDVLEKIKARDNRDF